MNVNSLDNNALLEDIFNEYNGFVSLLSRRMITNEAVAEEAAQEVWIEIVKSISTFKRKSKLSTWIYTIAWRVISKYIKNEITYTSKMVDDFFNQNEIPSPYENEFEKKMWVKNYCDKCFTAGLHCLDNESRIAKILHDLAHLSYKEIGSIINKNEQAVKKKVQRAREKVKNFINQNCAIINPEATCRCRIKKHVKNVKLDKEYLKLKIELKQMEEEISAEAMEKLIPIKEFWKKIFN